MTKIGIRQDKQTHQNIDRGHPDDKKYFRAVILYLYRGLIYFRLWIQSKCLFLFFKV